MAYCSKCGAEIAPGAKFCPECGAPVETAPEEYAASGSGSRNAEYYSSGDWTRPEVKTAGKAAFKRNYWMCVLVGFIFAAITSLSKSPEFVFHPVASEGKAFLSGAVTMAASFTGFSGPVRVLLSIFVVNFGVHLCDRFMLVNYRKTADLNELWTSESYLNKVATLFLRDLFTVLWTFLFIIPGVIKAYEYRMVTYILADHPEMSWQEVLNRSKEMMRGNKMKAFLLDLSFIGWILLGVMTLGIVYVFYTQPYMMSTGAALYERLRAETAV